MQCAIRMRCSPTICRDKCHRAERWQALLAAVKSTTWVRISPSCFKSKICRAKMRLATSASCFSELGQGRRAGCGHAPRPTSCSGQAAKLPACHFACLRGFRPAHACISHDLTESHDLSVRRALADKKDVYYAYPALSTFKLGADCAPFRGQC